MYKHICKYIVVLLLLATFLKGETNHKVPLFLSMVIPGGGQIYNRKYVKATVYIAVESAFIYGAVIQNIRLNNAEKELSKLRLDPTLNYQEIDKYNFLVDRYKKERNNFIWLSIGTVLLSAGDAYVDSYFTEFKRNIFKDGDKLSFTPILSGITLKYEF